MAITPSLHSDGHATLGFLILWDKNVDRELGLLGGIMLGISPALYMDGASDKPSPGLAPAPRSVCRASLLDTRRTVGWNHPAYPVLHSPNAPSSLTWGRLKLCAQNREQPPPQYPPGLPKSQLGIFKTCALGPFPSGVAKNKTASFIKYLLQFSSSSHPSYCFTATKTHNLSLILPVRSSCSSLEFEKRETKERSLLLVGMLRVTSPRVGNSLLPEPRTRTLSSSRHSPHACDSHPPSILEGAEAKRRRNLPGASELKPRFWSRCPQRHSLGWLSISQRRRPRRPLLPWAWRCLACPGPWTPALAYFSEKTTPSHPPPACYDHEKLKG